MRMKLFMIDIDLEVTSRSLWMNLSLAFWIFTGLPLCLLSPLVLCFWYHSVVFYWPIDIVFIRGWKCVWSIIFLLSAIIRDWEGLLNKSCLFFHIQIFLLFIQVIHNFAWWKLKLISSQSSIFLLRWGFILHQLILS